MTSLEKIINKIVPFKRTKKREIQKNKLVNPLFFDYECRFCCDNSHASENLYRVCKCKGSIEWCHMNCLYEWITYKKKNRLYCEICNTKYIMFR